MTTPLPDEGVEVVKWYTRARRFPQLIGKTPDGASIWGGPYTYTQVGVVVVLLLVGSRTTWLWGHFGMVGNALVLLGATYGVVLLVGRFAAGARNPLSLLAGVVRALLASAHGKQAGVPVRLRPPHHAAARLITTPPPSGPADDLAAAADVQPLPPPIEPVPALTAVQRLLATSPAPLPQEH